MAQKSIIKENLIRKKKLGVFYNGKEWIMGTDVNNGTCCETKQKISNSLLGHFVSEETRHKISESGRGRVSHNAKAVICIETGVEYRSAHYAELELGFPKDSVYRCCKGLQEQVNGYH